jgi:predicted choloylglycine hydrolase
VWTRQKQPLLVRNYDYHPDHCEGTILLSQWSGVKTIVQTDCIWGVLDGMNEHGLVVSLAFGGRQAVGDGFGIPLVLRYILEFCNDVEQARQALERIPSHMAYNVMALDRSGCFVNAHLSPDRAPSFASSPVATNHQREIEWTRHAEVTRSLEREQHLHERCDDPAETRDRFAARFLQPPLFSSAWDKGFGTLYTAVYDPLELAVEYRWRNHVWRLSFNDFDESQLLVRYR